MSEPAARPWDRQPDEPAKWFSRFGLYRLLGASRRSLQLAYQTERRESGEVGVPVTSPAPPVWRENAQRWSWRQRAESWDAHELDRVEDEQRERRDGLRAQFETTELELASELFSTARRLLAEDGSPPAVAAAAGAGQRASALWREAIGVATADARLAAKAAGENAKEYAAMLQRVTATPVEVAQRMRAIEQAQDATVARRLPFVVNPKDVASTFPARARDADEAVPRELLPPRRLP